MTLLRVTGATGALVCGAVLSLFNLIQYYASNQPPKQPDVVVYSKNLLAAQKDMNPVIGDIAAAKADLVLLQEVSVTNRHILDQLKTTYPHQHYCPFISWSGVAILSRWPLEDKDCSRIRTFGTAKIKAPFGSFHAGSVHMLWPYPHNQTRILNESVPMLEKMRGDPAILGGDFNMVPWSFTLRRIQRISGTEFVGAVWNTIDLWGLPLPIDHVLSSGTGSSDRRPLLGSDHHGLVARIKF